MARRDAYDRWRFRSREKERENSFKIDHFERLTRLHLRSRPTFPYGLPIASNVTVVNYNATEEMRKGVPEQSQCGALFNSSRVIHSLRLNGDYTVHFHILSVHYKIARAPFFLCSSHLYFIILIIILISHWYHVSFLTFTSKFTFYFRKDIWSILQIM